MGQTYVVISPRQRDTYVANDDVVKSIDDERHDMAIHGPGLCRMCDLRSEGLRERANDEGATSADAESSVVIGFIESVMLAARSDEPDEDVDDDRDSHDGDANEDNDTGQDERPHDRPRHDARRSHPAPVSTTGAARPCPWEV